MSFSKVMDDLASSMGLDVALLDPAQRGVLALVRAGAELHRRLPEGNLSAPSRTLIGAWGRLLAPQHPDWLRRVLDGARPTFDPRWVHECLADPLFQAGIQPTPLIAGLSVLIPTGLSQVGNAWRYIGSVANYVSYDDRDLSDVRGWLFGSAPSDVHKEIEGQLDFYAQLGDVPAAVTASIRESHKAWHVDLSAHNVLEGFESARRAIYRHAVALEGDASELLMDPKPLRELREIAELDRFSIAVIGEFKRGKSTLINALLGTPDLMPTLDLPCTMAVTEIRHGVRRYEVQQNPDEDRWEERSEQSYREAVAMAHRYTSRSAASERPPLQRWRVHTESTFLDDAFVELVDTPGLNEDKERDRVAHQRASQSDGALIVLTAMQLLSSTELEMVQSLRGRMENLAIAINFGDHAGRDQSALIDFCAGRLAEAGVPIDLARIAVVSAKNAEDGIRRGVTGEWSAANDRLRAMIREKVLAKSVVRKRLRLIHQIKGTVGNARENASSTLARRQKDFEDLNLRVENRERAVADLAIAKLAIERATAHVAEANEPIRAFEDAFFGSLPRIFEAAKLHEANWTSDAMPVFSPKKHAMEVAEKMKKDLLLEVERWIKDEGAKVVAQQMHMKLEQAGTDMQPAERYLKNALGLSREEIERRSEDLKRGAVQHAFNVPIDAGAAVAVGVKVALMTVITLVVGYVIADVVLYYVLSVIAGFLNPILLAAAALVGIAAYWIKGDDWVRGWIRGQILGKAREGLEVPEAREKIASGLRTGMTRMFSDLSRGFERSAQELLQDAEYNARRSDEELERIVQQGGGQDVVAKEIERLRTIKLRADANIDALERLATTLTGSDGPQLPAY